MYSEILKIKPQLDNSDLSKMEATLVTRFGNVAKKFGSGLKKAIITGGIVALGTAVISKLLNPLKDIEEKIRDMLHLSDDIVTNAKQFGTTSGKYAKLLALGKATGVEEQTMMTMLNKFQVALAEERAKKPGEAPGTLANFTGTKDTAEAFYQFAQSLQKLDTDQRVLVQSQIFGERLMGKAFEFFQPGTDYNKIFNTMGAKGSEYYTPAIEKSGNLSDLMDQLTGGRYLNDFVNKSKVLTENQVRGMNQSEQLKLTKENQDIKKYDALKPANIAIQELTNKFDAAMITVTTVWAPLLVDGINKLTTFSDMVLEKLATFTTYFEKIMGSRWMRGIFK